MILPHCILEGIDLSGVADGVDRSGEVSAEFVEIELPVTLRIRLSPADAPTVAEGEAMFAELLRDLPLELGGVSVEAILQSLTPA
jgi:hypothetical protein